MGQYKCSQKYEKGRVKSVFLIGIRKELIGDIIIINRSILLLKKETV